MIENIEPVMMRSGERLTGRIQYYDYGVVSIDLESRFEGNWTTLIEFRSRRIGAPDIERSTVETFETVSRSGAGPCQNAYLMAL